LILFFHGIINKGANLSVAPFFFFRNIILTIQYSYPYLFINFIAVLQTLLFRIQAFFSDILVLFSTKQTKNRLFHA